MARRKNYGFERAERARAKAAKKEAKKEAKAAAKAERSPDDMDDLNPAETGLETPSSSETQGPSDSDV